ncbi:myo-inositol-1(or 4)-monophosphatase [Bowdeniella nasicola]|uniref:Inositol-1-monophosphatase n=1 Tax=Bowdeniella nasicola TaxID=208480 RepID=A0A1H3Y8Y4_9ACTO|nr:inositol monophosphatase family protein [Bowdeniella nasicola]SEA08010.1 myo-inositol-1(or 4)-monophosphatase [Bowdeniella nasicola]
MTNFPAALPSPAKIADLACDIAVRAATKAKQLRGEGVTVAASKSTPTDLVTEADRATEAFIRDELARLRPGDGFYGEESGEQASTTGLTWVVDPIDGTVNYTYDIPAWATSIGVVYAAGPAEPETWTPYAGVVVNPNLHEIWRASHGGGAELIRYSIDDGTYHHHSRELLHLAGPRELATSLAATGFAYDADVRVDQARQVLALIDKAADIRRFGAASLDLVGVAAGRVHAYFEKGLHPFDHAAGALIAREAGAIVGGPGRGRENCELTYAIHPGLAAELLDVLSEIGLPV